ncbi:unnamed protein product, partial [Porites evermanni]
MKTLKNHIKGNLIYKFAMCIAETRPSTGQSLFPLDRMPSGLVEFQIEFFSATNIMGISVPEDYQIWYETMCAKFPSRLCIIGFRASILSKFSIEALKQLKVSNPKGRFWIKVDALDIKDIGMKCSTFINLISFDTDIMIDFKFPYTQSC